MPIRRSRTRASSDRILFVAALAASVACGGEAEQARRSEAGRLAEAVRRLRDAANADKRPFLLLLRETPCVAADACALRKTCVDAYSLETAAFDAIMAVRHATASGSPVPDGAAALLSRSEAELRRAAELTRTCADLEATARRNYRL
jgi:hypothetical protein